MKQTSGQQFSTDLPFASKSPSISQTIDGFSSTGFVKGKRELPCLTDDSFHSGSVVIGSTGKGEFHSSSKFDNFCVAISGTVPSLFYTR